MNLGGNAGWSFNPPGISNLNWIEAAGGVIPRGAVVGGQDHDCCLYIGQAYHKNDLLPGKVQPNHRRCYVAWGGKEHAKKEFKVLCGSGASWVAGCGSIVPPEAIRGGKTKDGETLYIGRVSHKGTLTVGKVHPSHGRCYIPYGGSEHGFQNYEILVSRPGGMIPGQTFMSPGISNLNWIDAAGGTIPPGAVAGGHDSDGYLYIGQAYHNNDMLPGKVQPNHRRCYVAWGGAEHAKREFKVLCGSGASWVAGCGSIVPPGAIPGGKTKDGETLYIGRVSYNGTLTVGKVHPSHGRCYIPYGGSEHGFQNYEILVSTFT